MVDAVNPPDVWPPFGAFSMAVIQGDGQVVHLKGQVSLDREGHVVGHNDMRAQVRQALENIRDVLAAMEADAGIRLKELRADGGAIANEFLGQFQSDILNVPVLRPKVAETTALGAAFLAGLATGFWPSREDIARQWAVDHRFEPVMPEARREALYAGWKQAVEATMAFKI